jgi:WD40 repeat protein
MSKNEIDPQDYS